jgi:tetratricopeptide (TPR) repeat protein
VCASSFTCQKVDLCALGNTELADDAANNFTEWLKANPKDEETRALMTQVWIDSSQYKKALDYWGKLAEAKPNDPAIMGNLAGINLKANDWKKSIEWYLKVAGISTDLSAKVAAYQFIGNVAWSKLNSKTLSRADSVDIADRGIGALQHAAELQPDNPKPLGLMASITNFRGQAQGPSWASSIDRAAAQDLQAQSRVLREKAKAAAGAPSAPVTPGAATNTPNPAKSGG